MGKDGLGAARSCQYLVLKKLNGNFSSFVIQEFGATARADTVGFEVKTVSAGTERAEILRQKDTALGTVAENKILTAPGAPVKRHIGKSSRLM